jgi:hypothetical protein
METSKTLRGIFFLSYVTLCFQKSLTLFQQYFSHIMAVSFIGRENHRQVASCEILIKDKWRKINRKESNNILIKQT